jgi:O-antigen/teichoic acid export membrane protein
MIILQKHISLKDIGLFSLAQQISMIPTLASIAIAKALQPLLFASKTDGELKGKVDQWDNIYKIFLIWMVGCMIFSIDILINLFLPTIYIGSIKIAQYMIFVNLIYNFALIENSILLYKMKSKLLSIITIAGAIINVLMSNWLVINYKINGVILAMLISFILTFTLEAYFSKKHIGFNYNILQLVISIGIILGFLILSSIELINKHYVFIIIYKIIGFLILSGLLYKSIQKVKLSHNRLS